ncbi:hypothetical protein CC78DRAFT_532796 [Lojkania enalia]|uniref:Uncharacterized protein n=1 Tax=Lojkania enalia TaxID=147567 RepID=A0A9P4K8X7_9PLEO|nr:hypothetical protein CC78DRAFT_532796 [Didymosphaeria enalia]
MWPAHSLTCPERQIRLSGSVDEGRGQRVTAAKSQDPFRRRCLVYAGETAGSGNKAALEDEGRAYRAEIRGEKTGERGVAFGEVCAGSAAGEERKQETQDTDRAGLRLEAGDGDAGQVCIHVWYGCGMWPVHNSMFTAVGRLRGLPCTDSPARSAAS